MGIKDQPKLSQLSQTGTNKLKKEKLFTDFELHEGWRELCRNEKRTLIQSIQDSINMGYVKDKNRAQQILNVELENHDVDNDFDHNNTLKLTAKVQYYSPLKENGGKAKELAFQDQIMSMRSNQFMAIEDKKHGYGRKKTFERKDVRCLQSKINLKFPIKEMLHEKHKSPISIKKDVLEEFEKRYKQISNPVYQKIRNSSVSPDNPFDKHNSPPKEYLQDTNTKLIMNPTKLDPKDIDISLVPLAGRMSEVGQKILQMGGKKANQITTFNWHKFDYPEKIMPGKNDASKNKETFNMTYGKFYDKDENLLRKSSPNKPNPFKPYENNQIDNQILNQVPNQIYANTQKLSLRNGFMTQKGSFLQSKQPTHREYSEEQETPNRTQLPSVHREEYLKRAKELRKQKYQERLGMKRRSSIGQSQSQNRSVLPENYYNDQQFNSIAIVNQGVNNSVRIKSRRDIEDRKKLVLESIIHSQKPSMAGLSSKIK